MVLTNLLIAGALVLLPNTNSADQNRGLKWLYKRFHVPAFHTYQYLLWTMSRIPGLLFREELLTYSWLRAAAFMESRRGRLGRLFSDPHLQLSPQVSHNFLKEVKISVYAKQREQRRAYACFISSALSPIFASQTNTTLPFHHSSLLVCRYLRDLSQRTWSKSL